MRRGGRRGRSVGATVRAERDASEALRMPAERADGGVIVLRAIGRLDAVTYRLARDSMIKAALAGPPAVIVDVARLRASTRSALAAFTSARWHVGLWPDVPIVIAGAGDDLRRMFSRQGVQRYVPVFATVSDAVAHAAGTTGNGRYRRRARIDVMRDEFAMTRAQTFIAERLSVWSMPDRLLAVSTVGRALVENAVVHTAGSLSVRLETDDTLITVAVTDDSDTPAARRERDVRPGGRVRGLDLVEALSRTWRNSPTGAGKTVWAAIGPEAGLHDVAGLIAGER